MRLPKLHKLLDGRRTYAIAPLFCSVVCIAALTALVFPSSCAAAEVTPEQVHKWWIAEIDDPQRADGSALLPFPKTEVTTKMSHIILDGLWQSPDYLSELTAWLAKPRPNVADDVVAQWRSYVQGRLDDSFDSFMPDDTTSTLLRLQPGYVVGDLPRDVCEDQTFESLQALQIQQQTKILDANGEPLAAAILTALKREFALLQSPAGKPAGTISPMPMTTYENVRSSLSKSDAARMTENYSHRSDGKMPRASDICLRGWITSHAVLDATVEDPSANLSARKLRSSMAKSGYLELLHIYNNGIKVPIAGFKPRHDLNFSELITRGGLTGTAYVVFTVDHSGQVGEVTVEPNDIRPESVTAIDGTVYKTADLIQIAATDYLKAGAFQATSGDPSAPSRKLRLPLGF